MAEFIVDFRRVDSVPFHSTVGEVVSPRAGNCRLVVQAADRRCCVAYCIFVIASSSTNARVRQRTRAITKIALAAGSVSNIDDGFTLIAATTTFFYAEEDAIGALGVLREEHDDDAAGQPRVVAAVARDQRGRTPQRRDDD